MSISEDEFNALQNSLLELKQWKYEAAEREKKQLNEIKILKESNAKLEDEVKSKPSAATSLFNKIGAKGQSKQEIAAIVSENDSLKRSLQLASQEHREQQEAVLQNVKTLFENNNKLEAELKVAQGVVDEKNKRVEELGAQVRQLKLRVVELEMSADQPKASTNKAQKQQLRKSSAPVLSTTPPKSTFPLPIEGGALTPLSEEAPSSPKPEDDSSTTANNAPDQPGEGSNEATEGDNNSLASEPASDTTNTEPNVEATKEEEGEEEDEDGDDVEDEETRRLKESLNDLTVHIRELEERATRDTQEHKTLEAKWKENEEALQKEVAEWKDKLRAKEVEAAKLEERLDTNLQDLKGQLDTSSKARGEEAAALKQEVEGVRAQLASREAELESARANASSTSDTFGKQLEEMKRTLEAEKNNAHDYHVRLSDMEDRLQLMRVSRDDYAEQVKSLGSKIANLEEINTLKTSQINNITEAAQTHTMEMENLRTTLQSTQASLTSQRSTNGKLEEMMRATEVQLQQTKEEGAKGAEELLRVRGEAADTTQRLKKVEQAKDKLEEEIDALRKDLEVARTRSDDLESQTAEMARIQEDADKNVARVAELEAQITTLQGEADTLKQRAEANDEELSRLRQEGEEERARIRELETALADASTEHKITERKSSMMIKDLKTELQKEKSSSNLLRDRSGSLSASSPNFPSPSMPLRRASSTMQAALATPPMSPTAAQANYATPSTPTTPMMPQLRTPFPTLTQQQQDGDNEPPVPVQAGAGGSGGDDVLRRDLDQLGIQMGKLGEDKWKLEEKTRFLEENIALLNEELEKKTKIIQFYAMRMGRPPGGGSTGASTTILQNVPEVTSPGVDKRLGVGGVLGSLFRGADTSLSQEMMSKMESVLEETVLKNIQLQNDIGTISKETSRLLEENREMKKRLAASS